MEPREPEARQISLVFHAALVAIGLKTLADAGEEWQEFDGSPTSAARWLSRAVARVGGRRSQAWRLGYTYYRLHRALLTGYTYPAYRDPLEDNNERVGLAKLREDFFSLVEDIAPELLDDQRELVDINGQIVTDPPERDDPAIDVEPAPVDLEEFFSDLEQEGEEEAANQMDNVGRRELERKIQEIDKLQPTDVTPPARQTFNEFMAEQRRMAREQAEARQAAAAERVALNGARDTVQQIAIHDPRVIGFVRVSGTGNPCGWCAMLISRGLKSLYRSEAAGGTKEAIAKGRTSSKGNRSDDETFHDHCKCYAEPVYTDEQYEQDDRFDLNRELKPLWGRVTDGYKQKEAIRVWRKFIRKRQAQAAQRATNN